MQLIVDTNIQMTNALPGQTVALILQQNEIGNHQITWGKNVRFSEDIPPIMLTNKPRKHDKISFVFNDHGADYYDVIGIMHHF